MTNRIVMAALRNCLVDMLALCSECAFIPARDMNIGKTLYLNTSSFLVTSVR